MAPCQIEETVLTGNQRGERELWLLLPPGGELGVLHLPLGPSLHEQPTSALCWQVIYIEADGSLRWCYGWSCQRCQTMKRFFPSSLGEVCVNFEELLFRNRISFFSCFFLYFGRVVPPQGGRGRDKSTNATYTCCQNHLADMELQALSKHWCLKKTPSRLSSALTEADWRGEAVRRSKPSPGFIQSSSFITGAAYVLFALQEHV